MKNLLASIWPWQRLPSISTISNNNQTKNNGRQKATSAIKKLKNQVSSVSLNYEHIPDSFYNKINNKSKYNSDSDVLFTWKYYFSFYTQNIHILFNCVIAISLWLVVKFIGNFIWVKIVSMLQWEKKIVKQIYWPQTGVSLSNLDNMQNLTATNTGKIQSKLNKWKLTALENWRAQSPRQRQQHSVLNLE